MHILVTGFGPFLGHSINPAGELAQALNDSDLISRVFTVSYASILKEVPLAIKETKPDAILSFGLAASRKNLSLEKYGYNEMNCTHPDVSGQTILGEAILPNAPKQLATPFPVESIQEELAKEGIVAELSNDPGRYICNETYFLDLSSGIPSLFVHLPTLENSSLENDKKAAAVLLKEIRRYLH
jgi:pyroglutamyl-peptidase